MKNILIAFALAMTAWLGQAQAPGTTPVDISKETQLLHGRRYYVHIVKQGQTVYSIARAYKVESFDAVTHHDIHFLHEGDTVWLPARGQFSEDTQPATTTPAPTQTPTTTTAPTTQPTTTSTHTTHSSPTPPAVRPVGKVLKIAVMMPLHLDQIDQVSTSKFDIEQRGKKSYKQFEFIEFYEGLLLALDELNAQGISVELNVADVSENNAVAVEEAFRSHNMQQSDLVIALLLREAFDRASDLAKQHGVHIVNPMATRSELCDDNAYMVKVQPSLAGRITLMLRNMKLERPDAHLYIIHSGSKQEKATLDELKRQLADRGDIPYTLFNWSQSARLASVLKATPSCHVLSIYDQGKDENRVCCINLLNKLAAFKKNTPVLYSLTDWTHEYSDIDYAQLGLLNYHTYSLAWDMTNDTHVQFLARYRQQFHTEPTTQLAATAYDLMLCLGTGLAKHGSDYWRAPSTPPSGLVQPLHWTRRGEGWENDRAMLYRLADYHFIKASLK